MNVGVSVGELKSELRKHKLKYLKRYIQILKLHVKEELTPEEKDELKIMSDNGKLLVSQLAQSKKDHIEFINSLVDSNFIQDNEFQSPPPITPERNINKCKLCHENKDHEIIDCPMNCCGTPNGECLR
jgi:hypothetical protein